MIYFRGCVARLKANEIVSATEIILDTAGVDFQYLDEEECCGSVLLRTGFVEEAHKLMQKNLKKFQNQRILVSCGGCYRSLKKDYRELMGIKLSVIHTSQFFKELETQGKLKLKSTSKKITYHDPCHLGRHMGEYESPRDLIKKIGHLVEMEHHHEQSRCCGSGGGVRSAYGEIADGIADQKFKEIEKTRADYITTSCSFCKLNLNVPPWEVWDLSELIVMFLEGKENER